MNNIILTSCGIINEEFKDRFYKIINIKETSMDKLYLLYDGDGIII